MTDRPLTAAEYAEVLNAGARRNPELTKAQPKDRYRDPACCAKYADEREETARKKGVVNRKYAENKQS
ncbi:hypothetical protein CR152_27825 [Massilia violaceinigra]|uniref:Uncharacterized protein n=1 Tax=Massilia violaceinigra TaxID=2045208 RepID=A0A2D2DSG7_9BURK|nr:hypothetical protein [Massilia violaceinigra]ATQ77886.1 hypothetical protein CR152_27825 [Massilia violaceinigra]